MIVVKFWATEYIKSAARNLRPTLVVAGSRIRTTHHDTGAGHITPATAISQQLARQAPSAGVDFHPVLAQTGPAGTPEFRDHTGKTIPPPRGPALTPDVAFTTGFGNVRGSRWTPLIEPGHAKDMPEIVAKRTYDGVPDMDPGRSAADIAKLAPAATLRPGVAAAAIDAEFGNKVRFGLGHDQPGTAFGTEASPYLTNDAIAAAHSAAKESPEAGNRIILTALAKSDPEVAKRFLAHIKDPKTPSVFISGSGRGDYTYSRALALAKQNPKRPIVVALGPHGEAMQKALGPLPPNVFPLRGSIPQATYMAMRGGVKANLGATSAAEYAEQLALPSRNLVLGSPAALKYVEAGRIHGKWPESLAQQHSDVDLASWNRGQIQHARETKPVGFRVVDDPRELESTLQDTLATDSDASIRTRASEALRKSQLARENLADFLLRQTHDQWKKTSSWQDVKRVSSRTAAPALAFMPVGALVGSAAGVAAESVKEDPEYLGALGRGAAIGALGGAGMGAAASLKSAGRLTNPRQLGDFALRGALAGGLIGGAGTAITQSLEGEVEPLSVLTGAAAGAATGAGALAGLAAWHGRGGVPQTTVSPAHPHVAAWQTSLEHPAKATPSEAWNTAVGPEVPPVVQPNVDDELARELATAQQEETARAHRVNAVRASLEGRGNVLGN